MKKVVIISLTLALVVLMTGAVSATDVTLKDVTLSQLEGYGETVVSYGISEGYHLQIPSDFEFTSVKKIRTSEVSATSVSLFSDQVLNVTVSSHHGWKLVEHEKNNQNQMVEVAGGSSLSYQMSFDRGLGEETYSETNPQQNVVVLLVSEGTSEKATDITFELLDTTNPSAGHYQDKLYFVSEIQSVSP